MTKQQRIEQLEEQLKEAYEIIRQLKKDADEGFKASPEHNRMEQEIKSLSLSQSLVEQVRHNLRLLIQRQAVLKLFRHSADREERGG